MDTTTDFFRKRFEKVAEAFKETGLAPSLSQLRMEQPLINGNGRYQFKLTKDEAILQPTEVNLKRNDMFSLIGVFFGLSIADPNKPGADELFSFAKIGNSAATPVIKGFKTDDINALYNANLTIRTGTTVNIENHPIMLQKRVDNFSGSAREAGVPPAFSLKDSMFVLPEELLFTGTQEHTVEVNFPTFTAADYSTIPTGTVGKIVMILVGLRVPGGASETWKNRIPQRYADTI